MTVVLATPRLVLRDVTRDDLDFLAEMRGDPEVMRFWPSVMTRAECLDWIEGMLGRYARDGIGQWLVIDPATRQPFGTTGLVRIALDGADEVEVGYMIHRPFWRRGYATEAAAAARDYAFHRLGRSRVIARVRPENLPSQGVARKLGMVPEDRLVLHADMPHLVFTAARPGHLGRHDGCTSPLVDQGTHPIAPAES